MQYVCGRDPQRYPRNCVLESNSDEVNQPRKLVEETPNLLTTGSTRLTSKWTNAVRLAVKSCLCTK